MVHHRAPWRLGLGFLRVVSLWSVFRFWCRWILGICVGRYFRLHKWRGAIRAGNLYHLSKKTWMISYLSKCSFTCIQNIQNIQCVKGELLQGKQDKKLKLLLSFLSNQNLLFSWSWPLLPHPAHQCDFAQLVLYPSRTRHSTHPPSACEPQTGLSSPCSSARLGMVWGSASGFPPGRSTNTPKFTIAVSQKWDLEKWNVGVECANLVDSMPHRHTSQWYKKAQQLLLFNHCRK